MIEIQSYKWPHRPTTVALAHLLGDDEFGRWLGIFQGDLWWAVDGSKSGAFEMSFVKVIPSGTFWTACFNLVDPLVDVDIVLPVRWFADTLEEVDLELDILRFSDGSVRVRDQEVFDQVRKVWAMPDDIVTQAIETCEWVGAQVELGAEPFAGVGRAWLDRFLIGIGAQKPLRRQSGR